MTVFRFRRAAFAVLLFLTATSGILCPVLTTRPAFAISQNENEKRMVDAVTPALVKTELAEKLFGERKWAECLAAIDDAEKIYDSVYKWFSEADKLSTAFEATEFANARKYGFLATEAAQFSLQKHGMFTDVIIVPVGGGRVAVSSIRAMLKQMRPIALVFSGKFVPYVNDGVSQPNEFDVKDLYEDAFHRASGIEMPVPDDQWEGVVLTLNRCALMIEAAKTADPALESREFGDGRGHQVMGSEGRKKIQEMLAEAEKEYKPASTRLAAELPKQVGYDLDNLARELDGLMERVNNGSYYDIDNAGLVGGYGKAAQFAELRKRFADYYAKDGKAMPADVLKPLEAKIAEVNAVLDKKVPGYTFDVKVVAPANIATVAKAAVLKNFPTAKVTRVGLDDTTFAIYRNDLGIITGRGRHGRILFQMPGEKWHRSLLFDYFEDNAGGNTYSAPGRVGLGNILRFESGK